MKLRNKKTGEIVDLDHFSMHYNRPEEWGQQPCSTWNHSLAELNEEWEDYKPDTKEKLKAWRRLEDKGFRFKGVEVYDEGLLEIDAVLPAIAKADDAERLKMLDDLELLFPEEEEE